MLRLLIILYLTMAQGISQASDGPQNTGILTLKRTGAQSLEGQLQIDRTVFFDSPATVLGFVKLTSGDNTCAASEPTVIAHENVLSALITFECSTLKTSITISLADSAPLPTGFTLGVRTNINHFVLDKDNPSRNTIISPDYLFFLAGLGYFGGSRYPEQAHLGRPHALYFGGLTVLPAGSWLLLLVGSILATPLKSRQKVLITGITVAATYVLTVLVLYKQASLSLIPVKPLGLGYLAMIVTVCGLAFLKAKQPTNVVILVAIAFAIALSGLEHAVMLRWLEGQDGIGMPAIVASFFLGVSLTLILIASVALLCGKLLTAKGNIALQQTTANLVKGLILSVSIYAAAVTMFKIM